MNIKELKSIFENYTGFISVVYTNASGEKAKHLVNLGFNYGNAVEKDKKIFTENEIQYIASEKYTLEDWNKAYAEKNQSLIKPSEAHSKGQTEAYVNLTSNGTLKYCIETGSVYVRALGVKKEVIESGVYKVVNSSAKTLAKQAIEKQLHTSKIKNFKFEKIKTIRMSGNEIEIVTE